MSLKRKRNHQNHQLFFMDKELLSTPSIKESGMNFKEEILLRFKACKIIERVGKELNLYVFLVLPFDELLSVSVLRERAYAETTPYP